jgi:hypothetical protein
MQVNKFTVPGHSTRREFSVYVVVAKKLNDPKYLIYVGKTGDNRKGCNPVISRAGNHFSYNDIHSQLRNKLQPDLPHVYDYKYFYITFDQYSEVEKERLIRVDVINEMERAVNEAIQNEFRNAPPGTLLNPFKGKGIKATESLRRKDLRTKPRMVKVDALVEAVAEYIKNVSASD